MKMPPYTENDIKYIDLLVCHSCGLVFVLEDTMQTCPCGKARGKYKEGTNRIEFLKENCSYAASISPQALWQDILESNKTYQKRTEKKTPSS